MRRSLAVLGVVVLAHAGGCEGCGRIALSCGDDVDCLGGDVCAAGLCVARGAPPAPVDDAGTPGDDAGVPLDDAGTPGDDAGTPGDDAGVPVDDAGVPLDWFDTAWTRRARITFDRPAGEELVDVPVLVVLDSAVIDLAGIAANGEDLRFVLDDNETVLPHEVEAFDAAGRSFVWVKVPRIDATSTTGFIWVYFANPAAPDAQDKTAVWTNGFVGVWHLGGDPLAGFGNQQDSTSFGFDGTALGMGGGQRIGGQVGQALSFDGDDVVRVDDSAVNSPYVAIGALTLSAWVFLPFDTTGTVVARREGDLSQWQLQLEPFGTATPQASLVWTDDGFLQCIFAADVAMPIGDWHHVAVTVGDDGRPGGFFIDGARVTFSDLGNCNGQPLAVSTDVAIGARWAGIPAPGFPLVGSLDEVRVEGEVRSDAWIAAQVRAMRGDFVTIGSTETVP